MKFGVMTLFPEMIENGFSESILKRAVDAGYISVQAVDIRDYTTDKHGKVDDYTYGGGAGMLIGPQPVYDCYQALTKDKKNKPRTIYVTPQGKRFDQKMAKELAMEEEIVFLCGHYEGVDERVLEEIVTDYVSIGDYVLTGGELAVMVMIDAIARLVPGVLNNETSAETESFHNDLLEYPQYTRPPVWQGKEVPEVLLSGNHRNIMAWRLEESEKRTKERRPDLYAKYERKQSVIKRLSKKKRLNIHMIELIRRGIGEIVYEKGEDILVREPYRHIYMMTAKDETSAAYMIDKYMKDCEECVVTQEFVGRLIEEKLGFAKGLTCEQYMYTDKENLPVTHKDIRPLTLEHLDYVCANYLLGDEAYTRAYVKDRIIQGDMFGAFLEDRLVGFAGLHVEGGCGLLFVEEGCRGMKIGSSLEAFVINHVKNQGMIPYGQVEVGNVASTRLQEGFKLYKADSYVYWYFPA